MNRDVPSHLVGPHRNTADCTDVALQAGKPVFIGLRPLRSPKRAGPTRGPSRSFRLETLFWSLLIR